MLSEENQDLMGGVSTSCGFIVCENMDTGELEMWPVLPQPVGGGVEG